MPSGIMKPHRPTKIVQSMTKMVREQCIDRNQWKAPPHLVAKDSHKNYDLTYSMSNSSFFWHKTVLESPTKLYIGLSPTVCQILMLMLGTILYYLKSVEDSLKIILKKISDTSIYYHREHSHESKLVKRTMLVDVTKQVHNKKRPLNKIKLQVRVIPSF